MPELRGAVESVGEAVRATPKAGRAIVWLALLAGAMTAGYGVLVVRHPLLLGILAPTARWTLMVHLPPSLLFIHLGLYLILTILYMLAHRVLLRFPVSTAGSRRWAIGIVVGGWLLCSLVLLGLAPGGESHDLFDYLYRGRMAAEFGASPLALAPAEVPPAPYLAYITWRTVVDTYGPVWELASAGVASGVRVVLQAMGQWWGGSASCPDVWASCTMLIGYVTGYRLLAIGLAGASGWLIYDMLRRRRPAAALAGLGVWLWNPLLLVSSAGGAHNDFLMLALWIAAFWCFQRRQWLVGLLVLVLAAHVKLTALMLAPVFALWLVRQIGWRRASGIGLLALAVTIPLSWLLYAPFGGWDTLPRMLQERSLYVANSPHQLLYQWLYAQGWPGTTLHRWLIVWPSVIAGALAVGISAWSLGFRPRAVGQARKPLDDEQLWWTATVVCLVYLAVGSFWFQAWYMLWVLAPAALLPARPFTRTILPWLTFGALASNLAGEYLPLLQNEPIKRPQRTVAVVTAVWGPGLAAWVVSRFRHHKVSIKVIQ